jgi:hypothetical protein
MDFNEPIERSLNRDIREYPLDGTSKVPVKGLSIIHQEHSKQHLQIVKEPM